MISPLPKIKHFSVKSELTKAMIADSSLQRVINEVGYPGARRMDQSFATLARIINSQLLSTQSAAAIWQRLEQCCKGEVTPKKFLGLGQRKLTQCGLSGRKREYICGIAEMICTRDLSLESLILLDDKQLIERLVAIRGIGVWTAEIYAIFALGRRDFYPARDLALQVAIKKYANLGGRPDHRLTSEFSSRWSPHRSAVALLMWKYYGTTTLD